MNDQWSKLIIIALLISITFTQVSGQNWGDLPDHPKAAYRFSINGLSASLERHVINNVTFFFESGIGWEYGKKFSETEHKFHLYPYAGIQIRKYYNIERRQERGKDVYGFFADYIAFVAILPYTSNTQEGPVLSAPFAVILINPYSFGLQWGIQRKLLKKGYFTFNIGPALAYDKDLILINNSPWFITPAMYISVGL